MQALIDDFAARYLLGIDRMDETHREFVDLVNRLAVAPKTEFATLFMELQAHTQAHFDQENAWMASYGFPALREHQDDHLRVLGELDRFAQRAASGSISMARAYVIQQLPHWFDLHAKTMDSALAHHMKLNMSVVQGEANSTQASAK